MNLNILRKIDRVCHLAMSLWPAPRNVPDPKADTIRGMLDKFLWDNVMGRVSLVYKLAQSLLWPTGSFVQTWLTEA